MCYIVISYPLEEHYTQAEGLFQPWGQSPAVFHPKGDTHPVKTYLTGLLCENEIEWVQGEMQDEFS